MTDTDNLDDLANAISKSSPKIRDYAIAQAAASQSQERDIRDALSRIAQLEVTPAPPPPPLPPPPSGLRAALGSTADHVASAATGQGLGFKLMRTPDWHPTDSVATMANLLSVYQSRGIEPLVLFNTSQMNTNMSECPGNLQAVAAALGPGGTQAHATLAPRWFEIGNEQLYKYSPKPGPEYADEYAAGWLRARSAIKAGNPNVRVAFTLDTDSGGSSQYNRIADLMYGVDPKIHEKVDAWIFHHYGPMSGGHTGKVLGMLAAVEAKGAPNTIPLIITEDGIGSDNGVTLTYNWGYPTNCTYDQAGALIRQKFTDWRNHPGLGPRLIIWTQYQARDQKDPGQSTDHNYYHGVQTRTGGNKGGMTQAARDHAASYP